MNRGIDIMIPRKPEEQSVFNYKIDFKLFGKRLTLTFKVTNSRE